MRIAQLCIAAAMAASLPNLTAQEPDQPPPKFTATALLGAAGVKGANYQIAEAVRTEEGLSRVHDLVHLRIVRGDRPDAIDRAPIQEIAALASAR